MVPVVAARHAPTAALAWLVFIFFEPWLGLLSYVLVGNNFVLRRCFGSYCRRLEEIRSLADRDFDRPDLLRAVEDPHDLKLALLAERLVCMPILRGNGVELLHDGSGMIERLVEDIDSAKEHVHMLFYIFKDDPVGWRVARALARAADRGIRCGVLVDAFGSRSLNKTLGPWLVDHGVELHKIMGLNPFRRHLTRPDLRNHRKLVVIDGITGYAGSQNVEDKNYDHKRVKAWHDLTVRVVGPAVTQLQKVFIEDWCLATNSVLSVPDTLPVPMEPEGIPIQVMPTGPIDSTRALPDVLVASINCADSRVIITSPYFIPDEPLLIALRLASLKGTRVDLVVPRHADHPVVGSVARAYFDSLLASGVRIHFHEGLLHAKTMSVDDTLALIGSANFDRRSFYLHSELTLLLYGPKITAMLRSKQIEYIAQSTELDPERWSKRSRVKRLRDSTFKLLSPVL